MTLEKINLDQTHLLFAFTGKDREHISVLSDKANQLLLLIKNKQATKEDKQLYHAIKWILKTIGIVEKDDLVKV